MRDAAALPLIVITAWEGLVDRARLEADQTVLVHGGAGGVGHVAVQIASALGAEVFATASPAQFPIVRSYGGTPIDYTTTSVEQYVEEYTAGKGFDVIYDTVGGAVLDASFAAAKTYSGHVVSCLGWGTHTSRRPNWGDSRLSQASSTEASRIAGRWQKTLTLNGLAVRSRASTIMRAASSTPTVPNAIEPRPPSLETAAAIRGEETPAIGAWMIGSAIANRCVNETAAWVRIILVSLLDARRGDLDDCELQLRAGPPRACRRARTADRPDLPTRCAARRCP